MPKSQKSAGLNLLTLAFIIFILVLKEVTDEKSRKKNDKLQNEKQVRIYQYGECAFYNEQK